MFGGVTADNSTWVYSSPAVNVSSQLQATTSAFTFSSVTGTYVGTVTLTNNGGVPVPGPIGILLTNLATQLTPTNLSGLHLGVPYRDRHADAGAEH
jgi:hypothetical protein